MLLRGSSEMGKMKKEKDVDIKENKSVSPSLRSSANVSKTEIKNDKFREPHMVVFVLDGSCIQTCKSIKIDLNHYKSKYFIEPPKFISKMPKAFLEV
jgi:hypothetical protein